MSVRTPGRGDNDLFLQGGRLREVLRIGMNACGSEELPKTWNGPECQRPWKCARQDEFKVTELSPTEECVMNKAKKLIERYKDEKPTDKTFSISIVGSDDSVNIEIYPDDKNEKYRLTYTRRCGRSGHDQANYDVDYNTNITRVQKDIEPVFRNRAFWHIRQLYAHEYIGENINTRYPRQTIRYEYYDMKYNDDPEGEVIISDSSKY